jgi:hypothetical protein
MTPANNPETFIHKYIVCCFYESKPGFSGLYVVQTHKTILLSIVIIIIIIIIMIQVKYLFTVGCLVKYVAESVGF